MSLSLDFVRRTARGDNQLIDQVRLDLPLQSAIHFSTYTRQYVGAALFQLNSANDLQVTMDIFPPLK